MKEKNSSNNNGVPIGALFGFLRTGSILLLLVSVLMTVISVALSYLVPQIMRFSIDGLFEGAELPGYAAAVINYFGGVEHLKNNLYIVGLLVVGTVFLQAVASYFKQVTAVKASEQAGKNIRDRIYTHIHRLPFSWHSSIQTGDIIQRATQDSDLVKRYISAQLIDLVRIIVMAVLGLALMLSMNVTLTLIACVCLTLTLIFSMIYFPLIAKNFKKADEEEGEFTAMLQENLTGLRVVRAFGKQAYEKQRYEQKNEHYVNMWINLGKKLSIFWGSGDFFSALQTVIVLISGAFMCVNGTLTIGSLLAFITYNQFLIWPVRNLGRMLSETGKVKISLSRLKEILDAKPNPDLETERDIEIRGEIEFKNVSFSYSDSREVLKNISFKIGAGETLGIVGGIGSGKSTIAHLTDRLYDADSGQVLIDGVDIKEIKRSSLRRQIGLVLQEPFLFSGTLKENILTAAEDREAELDKYAAVASLESTVEELKDGYETLIGEKGVTLSGGQKQRTAIARTLIRQNPIVILDDSLSAVDVETDRKIRAAMKKSLKGSTVVIISHRIVSLMHADKILVMNEGQIEDEGTHNELLTRDGTYRKLYNIQMTE